jgi:excisionase family DNA binding protein|tara:strand:- start:119 stop:322 length:204 start_codon:yes stop_codon:yes gene_type:complete
MTILDQFFYRPQQVADVLGISRTEVYKLLNENKLTSVKETKKRLITRDSLLRYINHLNGKTRTYELK